MSLSLHCHCCRSSSLRCRIYITTHIYGLLRECYLHAMLSTTTSIISSGKIIAVTLWYLVDMGEEQMEPYVWKRISGGESNNFAWLATILNVGKIWWKLMFAASVNATIEDPNDIHVISARLYSHCAILKYAANTATQVVTGCFTPGSYTVAHSRSLVLSSLPTPMSITGLSVDVPRARLRSLNARGR